MQLDKTRIAIRERSNSDLLDLSFHVLRAHIVPLILLLALGVLPFALINYWLLHWIALTAGQEYGYVDVFEANSRYVWAMIALVFLQAPLATSLVTIYMGQAVFLDRPSFRSVFVDARRMALRQIWCQGFMRLAVPVTFAVSTLDRTLMEFQPQIELGVLGIATAAMALVRSVRPYISEMYCSRRIR